MSEKYLVCKGATVYCSKSISNNNPATAIPLNITSQTEVEINGGKVVATQKDCTTLNMNFGMCNNGSVPMPPCTANVLWNKLHKGASVTEAGLKLLTKASEGVCSCGGGKIKIAFHGQVATPQMSEKNRIQRELLCGILPVNTVKDDDIYIQASDSSKEVKKVISVEILGDNNEPITEDFTMFVNLPKEAKFVNNRDVKGLYQLGKNIKCRVKFNSGGKNKFKLTIIPDFDNIGYTNSEKRRNSNFRDQESTLELATEINGEKIIKGNDLFLSKAGGNIYHLLVEDTTGNTVTSVKITTLRKLYFVEVKMANLTSDIEPSLEPMFEEYKKHSIILEKLAEREIDLVKNIGKGYLNEMNFTFKVKAVYDEYKDYIPYCVAVAYADMLAIKKTINLKAQRSYNREEEELPLRIDICDKAGELKPLWQDIDDKDWYVLCKYIDSTGKTTLIEKEFITPVWSTLNNGSYEGLDVDLSHLPKGAGRIDLRINIADRMNAGLSVGANITILATRTWWTNVSTSELNEVAIHEIGHSLGLVVNGGMRTPDKHRYYYTGKGHRGPHCRYGVPMQNNYNDLGRFAKCVMFGEVCNVLSFCKRCAISVRKLEVRANN